MNSSYEHNVKYTYEHIPEQDGIRSVVNTFITSGKQLPTWDDVKETNGNPDFISILKSYPEFKKAVGEGADDDTVIGYLIEIVHSLFDKNDTFTKHPPKKRKNSRRSDSKNSRQSNSKDPHQLERDLRKQFKAWKDGVDYFSLPKAKCLTDVFSALDFKLHLLKKNTTDGFYAFFKNYVELYSKLNNKQTVPFYARSIQELAAMYTVYLNETHFEREEIKEKLADALKEDKKGNALSRFNTDEVRHYIMTQIFIKADSDGKNKAEILKDLCDYIRDNPGDFSDENHRFYCNIKAMLRWINNNNELFFCDGELKMFEIFCNDTINYKERDTYLRKLEVLLVAKLLDLSVEFLEKNDNEDDSETILSFLVPAKEQTSKPIQYTRVLKEEGKKREITIKYCTKYKVDFTWNENEIVFNNTNCDSNNGSATKKRDLSEVAESVVNLLRVSVMLSIIRSLTKGSILPTRDNVIREINKKMAEFGLLSLPTAIPDNYNEKSRMDFCVLQTIDTFSKLE